MKVFEFIAELQKQDPQDLVFADGHSGGYVDCTHVSKERMQLNVEYEHGGDKYCDGSLNHDITYTIYSGRKIKNVVFNAVYVR